MDNVDLNQMVKHYIDCWIQYNSVVGRSILSIPIHLITWDNEPESNYEAAKRLLDMGYGTGGTMTSHLILGEWSPLVIASSGNHSLEYKNGMQRPLIRLLIDYGAKVEPGQHYDEYVHQYAEEKRLKDNKKKDQQLSLVWSLKPLLPKDLIKQIVDEMK